MPATICGKEEKKGQKISENSAAKSQIHKTHMYMLTRGNTHNKTTQIGGRTILTRALMAAAFADSASARACKVFSLC